MQNWTTEVLIILKFRTYSVSDFRWTHILVSIKCECMRMCLKSCINFFSKYCSLDQRTICRNHICLFLGPIPIEHKDWTERDSKNLLRLVLDLCDSIFILTCQKAMKNLFQINILNCHFIIHFLEYSFFREKERLTDVLTIENFLHLKVIFKVEITIKNDLLYNFRQPTLKLISPMLTKNKCKMFIPSSARIHHRNNCI